MKKCILFVLLFPCLHIAFAQNEIQVVKIEQLKKVYTHANDTTYIINFFATWCGPCMQEMPILNQFYEDNKNTSKKLIFVSLDNAGYLKKLPTKLKKIGIKAPVYLLNESSDFSWLPYIDKRWQGSIPATMVVNGNKNVKAFFETPLEKGQLEFYLKKLGL
ncbi:MAG TPA: TlpA family protein disulfide reductase [Chitinophagales bacterium]|nr:TlpA family protein disulfide reductase [Chitinophagales bacterium]HMW12803.1 TlpA family protein disulfide reductase [Chitinophagales bacterium]HMX60638.1 TlpA family protein disulfide reductase [Chitinophagales bacterium]HMZ34212.1 TlpA family protein disulfide reductase [Chitinophagales bacterium]HNB48576.1 TlpA family protein disulfide reductase [Chitinophagales bacterium]